MDIETWFRFWLVVLAVGLGYFYLVVLVVTPLAAWDIAKMFKRLDAPEADSEKPDETTTA